MYLQGHASLNAGDNEAACVLLGSAFDLLGGLAMDETHPGFQEMSRAASLLSHRVRLKIPAQFDGPTPAPRLLTIDAGLEGR